MVLLPWCFVDAFTMAARQGRSHRLTGHAVPSKGRLQDPAGTAFRRGPLDLRRCPGCSPVPTLRTCPGHRGGGARWRCRRRGRHQVICRSSPRPPGHVATCSWTPPGVWPRPRSGSLFLTPDLRDSSSPLSTAQFVVDIACGALACISLWWRRRWPLGVALACAALGMVSTSATPAGLLALSSLAVYRPLRPVLLVACAVDPLRAGLRRLQSDDWPHRRVPARDPTRARGHRAGGCSCALDDNCC